MSTTKKPPARVPSGIPAENLSELRAQLFDVVNTHVPDLYEVIKGTRIWTNQQIKLFSLLLNKSVPDLSVTHNTHEHTHKNVNELTREELMLIASGTLPPSVSPRPVQDLSSIPDAEIIPPPPPTPHIPATLNTPRRPLRPNEYVPPTRK